GVVGAGARGPPRTRRGPGRRRILLCRGGIRTHRRGIRFRSRIRLRVGGCIRLCVGGSRRRGGVPLRTRTRHLGRHRAEPLGDGIGGPLLIGGGPRPGDPLGSVAPARRGVGPLRAGKADPLGGRVRGRVGGIARRRRGRCGGVAGTSRRRGAITRTGSAGRPTGLLIRFPRTRDGRPGLLAPDDGLARERHRLDRRGTVRPRGSGSLPPVLRAVGGGAARRRGGIGGCALPRFGGVLRTALSTRLFGVRGGPVGGVGGCRARGGSSRFGGLFRPRTGGGGRTRRVLLVVRVGHHYPLLAPICSELDGQPID